MAETVNLSARHDAGEWARYLPAISSFYAVQLGKDANSPDYTPKDRVPVKFEKGLQGLNFLLQDDSYFNYKYCLYSAGHAELDLNKKYKEPMIHTRDRKNTIMICDSGGFQIATGVIKVDWATVMTPAGDPLRERILRWMEDTGDWSMTLDVPAPAAEAPLNKKTGLKEFKETLDVTEYNLHYFMKNRVPGKTKFLNVLSGSSVVNSKEWFDMAVRFSDPVTVVEMGYDVDRTLEGYAFAGINMRSMYCALNRLLDLRDRGLLAGKDWIHFLGVGRLDWACYLTSVERQLRKHHNPNLHISFDAASPFVAAGGYGLCYDYNHFNNSRLTYSMEKALDSKDFKGSQLQMPFQSPIMDRLVLGDLCPLGHGDLNKLGKECKTSWDTCSYLFMMAHNVFNHLQAVQEVNRLADIEYLRNPVSYKDWTRSTKSNQSKLSEYVPNSILFFNNFAEVLFDPATNDPRQMIEDNKSFLDSISFGKITTSNFNTLFDIHHEVPADDELSDIGNERMEEFERDHTDD